MKNPLLVVSLVLVLCFVFGCQKQGEEVAKAPEVNVEADVAAIKASLAEWIPLYNAGDFDKIISFYAENAMQMPPNGPIRNGKEAILLGMKNARELNDEHCDSSIVEDVRVSGDLAVVRGVDTGTNTPRSGGEPVKYNTKWLIVVERQSDGIWKWVYEMWNDNSPLPETLKK